MDTGSSPKFYGHQLLGHLLKIASAKYILRRSFEVRHMLIIICTCYMTKQRFAILSNGPRQANLVLIAYASSEGSGEPAHPRSLARTSAARSYKQ